MSIKITGAPKEWRKGQTIGNFLRWMACDTGSIMGGMADPFYWEDERFDKMFSSFIKSINKKNE